LEVVTVPSEYDLDTRANAVRLVLDHRGEYPSERAAIEAVSMWLGVNADAVGDWIQQRLDDGAGGGFGADGHGELRELKRRNRELEETIEVIRAATSSLVAEGDPSSAGAPNGK
jgi:transposase